MRHLKYLENAMERFHDKMDGMEPGGKFTMKAKKNLEFTGWKTGEHSYEMRVVHYWTEILHIRKDGPYYTIFNLVVTSATDVNILENVLYRTNAPMNRLEIGYGPVAGPRFLVDGEEKLGAGEIELAL